MDFKIYVTAPSDSVLATFLTDKSKSELETCGKVIYNTELKYKMPADIPLEACDCDVIVTSWGTPKIDKSYLGVMQNLKFVAHLAGSVANLVSEELYQAGVRVVSANKVFARSVAEGCICYMLNSLRDIEKYSEIVRQGKWRDGNFYNRGLLGRKVGLVGFGTVARYLAPLLLAFGSDVYAYDKFLPDDYIKSFGVKPTTLECLFSDCDVVSIHLSKTPETEGMISKEYLNMLKDNALFINTARGAVVDEKALIEELKNGRIYAALDVFQHEPLDVCSPLRYLKNVLPLPHMAGPTVDVREECAMEITREIKRFQNCEPLGCEITWEQAKNMTH